VPMEGLLPGAPWSAPKSLSSPGAVVVVVVGGGGEPAGGAPGVFGAAGLGGGDLLGGGGGGGLRLGGGREVGVGVGVGVTVVEGRGLEGSGGVPGGGDGRRNAAAGGRGAVSSWVATNSQHRWQASLLSLAGSERPGSGSDGAPVRLDAMHVLLHDLRQAFHMYSALASLAHSPAAAQEAQRVSRSLQLAVGRRARSTAG
jgi:hypothetical protein